MNTEAGGDPNAKHLRETGREREKRGLMPLYDFSKHEEDSRSHLYVLKERNKDGRVGLASGMV